MGDAVRIEGLVKRFGNFPALAGLDLTVRAGEVHALLGPNGAGKSTTLRVLLGLLRADAGTVQVLGADPWRDAVALHRRLGYVPGEVALWPSTTGGETIDLIGALHGGLDQKRRAQLVTRLDLDETKRSRTYSKGNRQKVAIIAALSCQVDLLLLDEPTAGLDPIMESVFRAEILAEKARGRSVLLSSHLLSEVEALADRVSIIRDGRIVETGTLTQLRSRTRTQVRARLRMPLTDPDDLAGADDVVLDDISLSCTVPPDRLSTIMAVLARHGIDALTVSPPSLEELFLRHYDTPDGHVRPDEHATARNRP